LTRRKKGFRNLHERKRTIIEKNDQERTLVSLGGGGNEIPPEKKGTAEGNVGEGTETRNPRAQKKEKLSRGWLKKKSQTQPSKPILRKNRQRRE